MHGGKRGVPHRETSPRADGAQDTPHSACWGGIPSPTPRSVHMGHQSPHPHRSTHIGDVPKRRPLLGPSLGRGWRPLGLRALLLQQRLLEDGGASCPAGPPRTPHPAWDSPSPGWCSPGQRPRCLRGAVWCSASWQRVATASSPSASTSKAWGRAGLYAGSCPPQRPPPPAKGRGGASPSWGAAGTDRSPQRARGSVREGPACSPREGGTRCPAAPTKGRLLEARRAAVPGSLRPREGCKRSPSLTPGGGNGLGGTSAPPGSPRERGLHPCPPPGRALW